jgi:para-nitrobenzyl esterase
MVTTTLISTGFAQQRVRCSGGTLEGVLDPGSGVTRFAAIPFAAPPVGDLRWRPPQPVKAWKGVRKADHFGPRAMQMPVFGDMAFRSDGMSEDCLYLNVWTPAKSARARLPVLVYFYGGGFVAGDGSEGRYDGQSMATQGIVAVTVNYRLGVFGFFAHPDLTRESPHHACGNYGLLDQHAALMWVHQNIAAFGGDPRRVTIAGESAGSISVSAQMASPLSKGLMAQAIGESGAIIETLSAVPLAEAEAGGVKLASSLGLGGSPTLAALRAMPAKDLLEKAAKAGFMWFSPTVDGYLFPSDPAEIYAAGKYARVPLLAGVNSEEMGYAAILGQDPPTVENYRKALARLYPNKAEEVFKLYPASSEPEVMDAAQDLAGDRFISHGTWTWVDCVTKTGGKPTYYYVYSHPRPAMRPEMGNAVPGLAGGVVRDANAPARQQPQSRGAVHSAEIEYCMGNLDQNKVYAWTADDYLVSKVMQQYFANFIKTGSPNGPGLVEWPKFATGQRLVIDVTCHAGGNDKLRTRYEGLDQIQEK